MTFGDKSGQVNFFSHGFIFQVEGFVPGDNIDFPTLPGLTLSADAADTPDGQVLVYSGQTHVYSVSFDSSVNVAELKPVSDGKGGTEIVFDTSFVTAISPQSAGSAINWNFIITNEGDELAPYVPTRGNTRNVAGRSGITIGNGVDLGSLGITANQFKSIFPDEANDANLSFLLGAIGLTKLGAVNYLATGASDFIPGLGYESQSISVTPQQAALLDNFAKSNLLTRALNRWSATSSVAFSLLPSQAQTVAMDIVVSVG